MIKKNYATILAFFAIFSFSPVTRAESIDFQKLFSDGGSQAEYFNKNESKRILIRVNFISGVQRTGIHHVPDNVHLLDAIALAGGLSGSADPNDVKIRRKFDGIEETLEYDIEDIVENPKIPYPKIFDSDVIAIGSKSTLTDDTLTYLSITASILGVIISGYVVRDLIRDNGT